MLIFISMGPLGHEEPSEVKEISAETSSSIFEEAEITSVAPKYETVILCSILAIEQKSTGKLCLLVPAVGLATSFDVVTALT